MTSPQGHNAGWFSRPDPPTPSSPQPIQEQHGILADLFARTFDTHRAGPGGEPRAPSTRSRIVDIFILIVVGGMFAAIAIPVFIRIH